MQNNDTDPDTDELGIAQDDETNAAENPQTQSAPQTPDPDTDRDDRYADPADATVPRDSEGNRIPVDEEAGDYGLHKFVPMTYGDVQKYMGSGSQHDVEEEALARLFDCPADENGEYDPHKSGFILKPDYSEAADEWARQMGKKPRGRVTAEYIEDMWPTRVRDILMGLFEASRIDAEVAMEGTTARVEVDEGGGNEP